VSFFVVAVTIVTATLGYARKAIDLAGIYLRPFVEILPAITSDLL
jgi:hypothetical protein